MKQKQDWRVLGDNGKLTRTGMIIALIFPLASIWMTIQDVNPYLRLACVLGYLGFFMYVG